MNQTHSIAAGHEVTLEAADEVLKAGGNAFDAAIAAFVVSWIAEPVMSGAGGGAFANVLTKSGDAYLFDFFCQTPKAKRPADQVDFFPVEVDFGAATETFHVGKGSATVPGAVAGVFEIHSRLGSMPIRELLQPGIEAAKHGVLVNNFQFVDFQLLEAILRIDDRAKPIFFNNGELKQVGERMFMPQLADFLDYLGREGKDAFYRGEVAQKVVRDFKEGGGFLTMEDFEKFEVIVQNPLSFSYRNKTILTNPLPSTGGSLMAIFLKLLEQETIPSQPISKEHLMQIYNAFKNTLSIDKTPSNLSKTLPTYLSNNFKRGATTHFNVVDKEGNAISITSSIGEGCGYFIEGTDIQLNNMLGESALLPNGFHSWKEDVRLSSMMSPTLVLDENKKIEYVTGSGGAGRIPFAIAQVLKYLIDFKLPIETAVNAPRVHLEHEVFNIEKEFGVFNIESEIDRAVKVWEERSLYYGGVHTIQVKDGSAVGVGDERRDGVGG